MSHGNLFCVRRTPLQASGFQPLVRSFARAARQGCVTSVTDPDRAAYRVAVLDLLLKLNRSDDALAEAETYLRTVKEPLLLAA